MAMQQPAPKPTLITDKAAATLPADRTPSEVASLLKRPFAAHVIKSRKIGGRDVSYIAVADVIERLNKAAPVWSWQVTRIEVITMPIMRKGQLVDTPVVHVVGQLSIPGLGSREGVGTAPCENDENATKIAESDAVKRASSMFGVPVNR